ncbi:MAG: retron Eco8 family effector endonuclease [Roseburia sp.]|nr:retron Eco8 family effector endonuclease [Roseburia sp.]MCM1242439.1 retron Eco8 family effector endonuclease [Roseburia sp.]
MAIKRLEIKGYRSIDHVKLGMEQITAFIGANGSGKSNILSALHLFYESLTKEQREENIFDANNVLRNEVCIRITYDLKDIVKKVQHNQNIGAEDYDNYYRTILAVASHDEIVLEMIKRKGKRTIWNQSYNIRQIVSFLFPLYVVDSRQIMLTDWRNLWELIGDLVKMRHEDAERLQNDIKDKIKTDYESTNVRLDHLGRLLEEKRINVKKLTPRQLGEVIAEIAVGGQMFQYGERSLKEYSNGTNAYNYTVFLIDILNMLKKYKLKEPVVILDEPEISLHYLLIDALLDKIFDISHNIQFLIATHSSRCVKALLESEEENAGIYHVVLKGQYTRIKRVRNLAKEDARERAIITEAYTNSCFAKMVVNVEGETEMELLRNKYLRAVFPRLKEVEIVRGMSNHVIYNLTAPGKRNYQVPGFAVMDMDKVLVKSKKQNRFIFEELKGDYPIEKEIYHYGEKRRKTLYCRKRIQSMCQKCNFFFRYPFFSCDDENFRTLLELIIEYYHNYQVHLWHNTVEGALITGRNLELFIDFARSLHIDFMKMIAGFPFLVQDKNQQLNYMRLIFCGESDYLFTKNQLQKRNPKINKTLWKNMNRIGKTSGWISKWLEYYFLETVKRKKLDGYADVDSFQQFDKWIGKAEHRDMIREQMEHDFTELYALFHNLEVTMGKNSDKLA